MSGGRFSSRVLQYLVETLARELGSDQFGVMMSLSKLPPEWKDSGTLIKMDPLESAKTYAALQAAVRAYYGRGARGVLLRVGERLWDRLLDEASFGDKAKAMLIKRLPLSSRRKSTLELLAKFISSDSSDITVHTLDLDLLLADHASPAAVGQTASAPICFVTQGLIRESLFWATAQNHDVEETSCKALGRDACEFTIRTGK